MGVSLEWAAIVDCAVPGRLAAAERLVGSWPTVFGAALRDCDLAYEAVGSWFAAVVRFAPGPQDAEHVRRLRFWCERAGAEAVALPELPDAERIALRARIALSGRVVRAVTGDRLAGFAYRFFTECGAPAQRRRPAARPVLTLDAGTSGPLRWAAADRAIFVPGPLAPAPGDELQLAVPVGGSERPLECTARVRDVRAPEAAAPGLPAGFTLALQAPPPALVRALAERSAEDAPLASPAPAAVSPALVLPTPPLAAAPPRPPTSPAPASAAATRLRAANASPGARRALVVDDDAFARQLLGDALAALGFEVLTASDGHAGLRRLGEEVLGIDLLVTDLRMPGMDGGALVRTVRRGGETELAVVVVTGNAEPGTEPQLERDGADAVLDKALGAEIIARAAEAVVRRKRAAAA